MATTFHINATLKASISGGMRVSGTPTFAVGTRVIRAFLGNPSSVSDTAAGPPPTVWSSDEATMTMSSYPANPPTAWLQVGNSNDAYWVADGEWNDQTLVRGTYTNITASTYEQAIGRSLIVNSVGAVACRLSWKWPYGNYSAGTQEIKAYPSILYGAKPGYSSSFSNPGGFDILLPPDNVTSTAAPSGKTPGSFLPLQLPIASLKADASFSHVAAVTGIGHLTYDIWLQSDANQRQGFNASGEVTHEIMIPLTYWGNYGAYPDSRNPGWYDHDATIDGRLWHVYFASAAEFNNAWAFIVFEPHSSTSVPSLVGTLNIHTFVNYAMSQGWCTSANHLVSVELGIEPVAGTGDIFLTDYRVYRETNSPLAAGHSSGTVTAPPAYVSIATHGATADGTTNNIVAIRDAISAAGVAGVPCFVPAGDYAYSGNITLSSVAMTGVGPSSILRALDWTNRAVWLKGSSASIKNCALFTNGVVNRQAAWEYVGIVAIGTSNFTIHNCYIKHNGAAGIQIENSASSGTITNNTLSGTLADSIHITNEAHNLTVNFNKIRKSGDDGIACVSYSADGGKVRNVEASYNWIKGNLGGRGMSVVGGQDINYHNNLIESNTVAAGIYIAQEISYLSWGCNSVSIAYNTVINCGNQAIGHAGVMIFSDGTHTNSSIAVVRNDLVQTGENGIRLFGPQLGISLDSNRISSASSSYVNNVTAGVTTTSYISGNAGYNFTTP